MNNSGSFPLFTTICALLLGFALPIGGCNKIPGENGESAKPDASVVTKQPEAPGANSDIYNSRISFNFKEIPGETSPEPSSDILGKIYPCDRKVQSEMWSDLKSEERMLASGYEVVNETGQSFKPKKIVYIAKNLIDLLASYYFEKGCEPKDREELLAFGMEKAVNQKFESEEERNAACAEFLQGLVSPVTGKLIEWDHQNFSAGNAFVAVANDNPTAMKEIAKLAQTAGLSSTELAGAVNIYVRLYGKSGVISAKWSPRKNDIVKYD